MKGIYIVPGSHEWFTHMNNLCNNLPHHLRPPTKAERVKEHQQKAIISKATIRAEHARIAKEKERNTLIADAKLHGTSTTRYHHQWNAKNLLTLKSNSFYESMKEDTDRYHKAQTEEHKRLIMEEINSFNEEHVKLTYGKTTHYAHYAPLAAGASIDTSDDTKELELRPNKCDNASVTNIFSVTNNDNRHKRMNIPPASTDDSSVAGLSGTNN